MTRYKPKILFSELEKHTTKESCWLYAKNKVYDVTSFIDKHPNGLSIFLSHCGKDIYKDFLLHSKKNRKIWDKYFIGFLSYRDL